MLLLRQSRYLTEVAKSEIRAVEIKEGDPSVWVDFQRGMKGLGNGLFGLALLHALGAGFLVMTGQPTGAMLVGGMFAADLVLGIFAHWLHAWVNYVVGVIACLMMAMSVIALSAGASPIGICFGFIIAGGLLYYAVSNLQKLKKVRAQSGGAA